MNTMDTFFMYQCIKDDLCEIVMTYQVTCRRENFSCWKPVKSHATCYLWIRVAEGLD